MGPMVALVVVGLLGASAVALVPMLAAEQWSHRHAGRMGGVDGREGDLLADAVLAGIPVLRVVPDGVVFEDGSGILLDVAEPAELAVLAQLAAVREVVLAGVRRFGSAWRLSFVTRDATDGVTLHALAWRLAGA